MICTTNKEKLCKNKLDFTTLCMYVKGYIITLLYFLEASGLILTLRASVAAFKVELSNLITFSLYWQKLSDENSLQKSEKQFGVWTCDY